MSLPSLSIGGRRIAADEPPYIIAEISANHNGDIDRAFKLIERAKKSGADAVKLQTFRPDTITLDSDSEDFVVEDGLWAGRTLYNLYEEAHMPWEWHKPLFEYAREIGITAFSSPFDFSAVDFLESFDVPAYKIASFEAVDTPLIEYVAATGKPMIISTGMADASEIGEAVEAARSAGCRELMLLHCISGYPTPASEYNLRTMIDMANRFDIAVGLSDHTLDNSTAVAATALGASLIEKHFTLDRSGGGPDDSFSLEPADLAALCQGTSAAWSALGKVNYGRSSSERGNMKFRRSLYFVSDLQAGDTIKPNDIRSVRPGNGLKPKLLSNIIGQPVLCSVVANTPVLEKHIDLEPSKR